MAVQQLNQVQRDFVNGVARPHIEKLIEVYYLCDMFAKDYDNQQSAIAATADQLGDGEGGIAPRVDAPVLTGAQLQSLRTFSVNMRDQINAAALAQLIQAAVRSVKGIVQG